LTNNFLGQNVKTIDFIGFIGYYAALLQGGATAEMKNLHF